MIWQERCILYAKVSYLCATFISCTIPHHLCIMWLQIFMVPMCSLGCALAVMFVAILNGQRNDYGILRPWGSTGLNLIVCIEVQIFGWAPFKLPHWMDTHITSRDTINTHSNYHTDVTVICMDKYKLLRFNPILCIAKLVPICRSLDVQERRV